MFRIVLHSKMENGTASEGKDPSGFLSEILGAPVTVKLNSGVVYKGTDSIPSLMSSTMTHNSGNLGELQSVDGYMNIALEKTEEYVDGKLRRNYGDAFVRGNNGPSPASWPVQVPVFGEADGIRLIVMYISSDA